MIIKNVLPVFTTTIPSTGIKVKFNPFTDAQEKLLLIAMESGDANDMIEATRNLIDSCVHDIDVNELASFDINFLFLQLRIQSVSDKSELYYRSMDCGKTGGECEKTIKLTIDLSKVSVQQYDNETEKYSEYQPQKIKNDKIDISLSKSTGVLVKYPSFIEQDLFAKLRTESYEPTEDDLIKLCIVGVYDDEAVHTRDDFESDELDEFYSSLIPKQKDNLYKFIRNIPKLRYETTFVCKECGFKEEMKFEDLESFFA